MMSGLILGGLIFYLSIKLTGCVVEKLGERNAPLIFLLAFLLPILFSLLILLVVILCA